MNYQAAIDYIENLTLRRENRPSIERIEKFLSCHGNPQNEFKSMHIGGTNGKGSTVAMLDSILRASGFKSARFTGPHLLRLNERFHIDGKPIADDELAERICRLKKQSDRFAQTYSQLGLLSWFEFLTALAFFYFADHAVDIAVIEVGLGGRYDATNVLQRLYVTGITNIAFDHERILGSTLAEIAAEKAGIIKPGVPVVTGASNEALDIIVQKANQLHSQLIVCDTEHLPSLSGATITNKCLTEIKNYINRYRLYQYNNALMALHMISAANLPDISIDNNNQKISSETALLGLKNFYWPGRFQIVESERLILDCGHNPACAKFLRESLDSLQDKSCFHFVFACYADKDGMAMLRNLLKPGDYLYLGEPIGKRVFSPNIALAEYAQALGITTTIHANTDEAFAQAKRKRKNNEYIVATGSFSVVKSIMQTLGWTSVENGFSPCKEDFPLS